MTVAGNGAPAAQPQAPVVLTREPYPFECSRPGVFAAGDVRHGSMKRVAGAVGEGSVAVGSVHRYLAGAVTSRPRATAPIDTASVWPPPAVR